MYNGVEALMELLGELLGRHLDAVIDGPVSVCRRRLPCPQATTARHDAAHLGV